MNSKYYFFKSVFFLIHSCLNLMNLFCPNSICKNLQYSLTLPSFIYPPLNFTYCYWLAYIKNIKANILYYNLITIYFLYNRKLKIAFFKKLFNFY